MRTVFLIALLGLAAVAGCSDPAPTTQADSAQPAQAPRPVGLDGKQVKGRIPPPPK